MYGRSGRSGGGWRQPPPNNTFNYQDPNLFLFEALLQAQNQNAGFSFQNPNYPVQNPNFAVPNPVFSIRNYNVQAQNPAFAMQNPNFQLQNSPLTVPNFAVENPKPTVPPWEVANSSSRGEKSTATSQEVPSSSSKRQKKPKKNKELLEKCDIAVKKARRDLIDSGKSVSSWKVSQLALWDLEVDSWSSLELRMQHVPALNRLIDIEGKINAFIHCFVGVSRITSLYELEVAICKNEGIERFEELELGPLLRHPLILHYFSIDSEATNVFKITIHEIISLLSEFMDSCINESILVEEFLDFISKKRSVAKKELLGVRVQNIGIHVSVIREAKDSEDALVDLCPEILRSRPYKKLKERSLFALQKKKLDERFSAISQRVESFSPVHKDFRGKHIRFDTSCSESEDSDNEENNACPDGTGRKGACSQLKDSAQSNRSSDRVSRCPYPSATEEMTRLRKTMSKSEVHGSPSPLTGKRKSSESNSSSQKKKRKKSIDERCTLSVPPNFCIEDEDEEDLIKVSRNNKVTNMSEADKKIPKRALKMFIETWKDTCRNHSVSHVFERMLQFYSTNGWKKRKTRMVFLSYPFIGLLNVAVLSIKKGMWDSIYDTFQAISEQDITKAAVDKYATCESIDVEPTVSNATVKKKLKHRQGVHVHNIIRKVNEYLELDLEVNDNGKSHLQERISFLKKLCHCESWLVEQFSIREFKSLGHGDFFTFLEKHTSLLPTELHKFLIADFCEKLPLEVCMHQEELALLVSQACNNLWENNTISDQMISMLLRRQFPLISLKMKENGSMDDFLGTVRQQKDKVTSMCVIFSTTLLENCHSRDSLVNNENDLLENSSSAMHIDQNVKVIGSVSMKDAIDVLARAPMLSDLNLWSHWDLVFSPSLGSLIPWLLNEVKTRELLCLITKDGQVIRIDHTATVDSFLEAALQGSPFQTAVKLLSLFSIVGGEKNVPLSLLKCHARHAFEVILKNSLENMDLDDKWNFLGHGEASGSQSILVEVTTNDTRSKMHQCLSKMDKAVSILSMFVLNCLGYLPAEFRGFTAEVLLSGMRPIIKDAATAILHGCNRLEQRLMLHELGLSLGIVEWIADYRAFCSTDTSNLLSSASACFNDVRSEKSRWSQCVEAPSHKLSASEQNIMLDIEEKVQNEKSIEVPVDMAEVSNDSSGNGCMLLSPGESEHWDAALVIESIRRDEFGLDPNLPNTENKMLMKQHARLGRALHCLSQELYSQDSHFLLELVQNADDNIYPDNVEPTLTFILQESGVIVLNNERGFSDQNLRALCDVGNSTKKGSNAGYIGKKGIGFKSVFRVTDAPEIHSNGFHVKFDISEGQIGFVLPTLVPPCNIDLFSRLASSDSDQQDSNFWNTCIVLPFRSRLSDRTVVNSVMTMFSDLHPSLLLFLHCLQCIKLRNMLNDSLIIMRKEILGDGIVKVSHGREKMTWLVVSKKLQADILSRDADSTEISLAFTLQEEGNGIYSPYLDQQPVFAFLPLRTYGLKFILQGDFVLPSSREEVDGDSPWNQWLLSEFPDLFVCAEKSFCDLPCFRGNPGKAIAAFMSFVPLVGEVHGFFSSLPRMIISKLRMANCLLLEEAKHEWVPPCKALRGWNEQARILLPDNLLHEHLGLGFLDSNIVLPEALARAMGIEEYGPRILVQFISSLCHKENSITSVGLGWLASWLDTLYTLLFQASGQTALNSGLETDLVKTLQKIPFIPLSDGTYSAVSKGSIWLQSDSINSGLEGRNELDSFPNVYAKLRMVHPALLSPPATGSSDMATTDNITRMLHRIGVQRLSAHEIIKVHILPALSVGEVKNWDTNLVTEYVCFVMIHLQSSCSECRIDKDYIISQFCKKALILTNHGFKRPVEVPIHFSEEYENPINMKKLINGVDMKWHEVDFTYLKQPVSKSLSSGLSTWRNFFQEIGVTDFVRINEVDKNVADISDVTLKTTLWEKDLISSGTVAKDWESTELIELLSQLSVHGNKENCEYLLEVFDTLWDKFFSAKASGYCISKSAGDRIFFKSSFMSSICDSKWVVSTIDDQLHYPGDLFYDCHAVRSVLGDSAPYAVPKVRSGNLASVIGFKTEVTLDDALNILKVWRTRIPFTTSISQMDAFYLFLWNEMAASKKKITEEYRSGPFIFVPHESGSRKEDMVSGTFMSPDEVYWQDPSGYVETLKDIHPPLNKTLCNVYPGLHNFFVNECGVNENPPLRCYLQILQQLSAVSLPSSAAKAVFLIFQRWAEGMKSGLLSSEDITYMKECLVNSEFSVLPTLQDRWVSLHPSSGLVCWGDDKKLKKQFKHIENIDFIYFGELIKEEKDMLKTKVCPLMKALGIPVLSEIVTREAIHYGLSNSTFKSSLVNWALPYAQRYLFSIHPDRYSQLKQSKFDILNSLQVIVVEKLFYRNLIKNFGGSSEKQAECTCLLQDNILYTTKESDSHTLFMKLSQFLCNGIPDLHLANFLHMITTMAESGSTAEQLEFFILNSQKMKNLPDEEPIWSLSSVSSSSMTDNLLLKAASSTTLDDQIPLKTQRKVSDWPPADWKTAPSFRYAQENGFKTQPAFSHHHGTSSQEEAGKNIPVSEDMDWTIVDDSAAKSTELTLLQSENLVDSTPMESDPTDRLDFNHIEQLHFGTPNPTQAMITGREGELVAFQYFAERVGKSAVRWVNEHEETGLPYDIVVAGKGDTVEYIEVKATRSQRKDWCKVSTKEWQFAVEKGDFFSIAHVVLLPNGVARVSVFKNPVRLCQLGGNLQLALILPRNEFNLYFSSKEAETNLYSVIPRAPK